MGGDGDAACILIPNPQALTTDIAETTVRLEKHQLTKPVNHQVLNPWHRMPLG